MYVDIYSLGFGSVMLPVPTGTFSIRNLQVLRRYRVDRVPEAALLVACGTLGKWNPLSGQLPKMEIVWHNEETSAWCRLDAVYRTPDVQKAGHQKPLFVPTDLIVKRLFPGMIRSYVPRVVGDEPLPPPPLPPSPSAAMVDARKIDPTPATGAMRKIEDVMVSGIGDISDAPPAEEPVPMAPPPARVEQMPDLSDLVSTDVDLGAAAPRPPEAARCRGSTGSGGKCMRKATTPEGFCRTHFSQAAV